MNVDEALLQADAVDQLGLRNDKLIALLTLAAEVRRQHAELERWQSNFDAERAELQRVLLELRGCAQQMATVGNGLLDHAANLDRAYG